MICVLNLWVYIGRDPSVSSFPGSYIMINTNRTMLLLTTGFTCGYFDFNDSHHVLSFILHILYPFASHHFFGY